MYLAFLERSDLKVPRPSPGTPVGQDPHYHSWINKTMDECFEDKSDPECDYQPGLVLLKMYGLQVVS